VSKVDALELYKDNVYKTDDFTNLEDGTITFCDHDISPTYVAADISRIPVLSKQNQEVIGAYCVAMKKTTTNTCLWNFISKTKDLMNTCFLLEEAVAITEN
jgi:threonyl-tRNA synthetase